MIGRKRSHSNSIQLTDKWGANSDNVDYITGQVMTLGLTDVTATLSWHS